MRPHRNLRGIADKLWRAFELDFFVGDQAANVLNVKISTANYILGLLWRDGLVQKFELIRLRTDCPVDVDRRNRYTFDFDKTYEDLDELWDPVPFEKRTLDVQLFGDELMRYLDIRRIPQNEDQINYITPSYLEKKQ